MFSITRTVTTLVFSLILAGAPATGFADSGHGVEASGKADGKGMIKALREQHAEHEHGHDFEAIEKMSPQDMARVVALMQDVGLVIPPMDASRGRKLFVDTGCIVCHSVNKVGGEIGPSLDAADLPETMNAFEYAARMWRGAEAMTTMQEEVLGGVISLTGQDLADLIAFAHDSKEQKKLTEDQVPEKFRKLIKE